MSFENMKQIQQVNVHERSCMMLYQFSKEETRQIMNVARMTGIKDFIELKPSYGQCTLREILDQKQEEGEETKVREKTLILNHIAPARMNMFIDGLKKCRLRRPIIAVVTEQSIEWKLENLLVNLVNERAAVRSGEFNRHEGE